MSFLRALAGRCRWQPAQCLVPTVSPDPSYRTVCSSALCRPCGLLYPLAGQRADTAGGFAPWSFPWSRQQVRTKKRGTEYQPKFIKRLRTHGWKKRISTPAGIVVILRRMLKGRTSLTH